MTETDPRLAQQLDELAQGIAERLRLPLACVQATHALLAPLMRTRRVDRGAHLALAGGVSREADLVLSGVARIWCGTVDGAEVTLRFIPEGFWALALEDALAAEGGQRAASACSAETALVVATGPLQAMMAALQGTEASRRYFDALLRANLVVRGRREQELRAMDAQARYALFRSEQPGLEKRITARSLASYLGVTPQYLSQMRTRMRTRMKKPAGEA